MAFFGACAWACGGRPPTCWRAISHLPTHGPLASPHAAFDENCARLSRVTKSPISTRWRFFSARDRLARSSLRNVHAGPADEGFGHHASANDAAKAFHQRCSNCHHDHLGRLNSLVKLKDADCNQCHSDLGKWHHAEKSQTKAKGEPPYQNKITSFASEHQSSVTRHHPQAANALTFSHAALPEPRASVHGRREGRR